MNDKSSKKIDVPRSFSYHVNGILDLQSRLRELTEGLGGLEAADKAGLGAIFGELEAVIFFQLPYHIKEVRLPFEQLLKGIYGEDASVVVDRQGSKEDRQDG